jgi:hypothetical protein
MGRLYCPFPSIIHTDKDAIQKHTDQWVEEFELIDSFEMQEKIQGAEIWIYDCKKLPTRQA